MARKRMIDPEFWSDEKVGILSFEARLMFIGMWNFADDEGIIKARPEFLKSNIFPYDDIVSDDVKEWFKQLVKHELIFAYTDSGQQYAIILNFGKHQVINKPLASKLPKPPIDKLPANYVPTTVALRSQMKGNEMKGNERNIYTPDFESFWKLYPKKVGKPKTSEYWSKLTPAEHNLIMEDIPKRMSDDKWVGGFIKDPERYIKNRQWEDEIITKKKKAADDFTNQAF